MAISVPLKKPDKIKFVYNTPENYDAQYVNGVLGGLTPRGDIILNFFYEHSALPDEEISGIGTDGLPYRELPDQETAKMLRDIKAGIIIAPHVAESIKGFLEDILKMNAVRGKQAETDASKNVAEPKEVEKSAQ